MHSLRLSIQPVFGWEGGGQGIGGRGFGLDHDDYPPTDRDLREKGDGQKQVEERSMTVDQFIKGTGVENVDVQNEEPPKGAKTILVAGQWTYG